MIKDIDLHIPEKFDKRFEEYTRKADTYEEAYIMVEKDYIKVFGRRKYSNYSSYRVSRRKRIKKRAAIKQKA